MVAPSQCNSHSQSYSVIRDPRYPDRFHCVYPLRNGRYRVRVEKRVNLGVYPTASLAAAAVVGWYQQRFGERWERVFKLRKANPCRVSREGKLFVAEVWINGKPIRVTPKLVGDGCGAVGEMWESRAAAHAAIRAVLRWLRPRPKAGCWRGALWRA